MAPQVNGDVPHSAFLNHFQHYPLVSDVITHIKSHRLGQKSIELSNSAYRTFAEPFLPYLNGPFQYVSPYVKRVDDLGEKTLSTLDEKFPVVKKPTGELLDNAMYYVFLPVKLGQDGKEHVVSTYSAQHKQAGGSGLVTTVKAALGTTLVTTSEVAQGVSDYLRVRKEKAQETLEAKTNN